MPDDTRTTGGIPAQSRSLLELIDTLREQFPDLSPHTVVRCVSIVANHPSLAALPVDALVRRTERISRARLTHINDLPAPPVWFDPNIVTLPRSRPRPAAAGAR